jgi:hypothetical protein
MRTDRKFKTISLILKRLRNNKQVRPEEISRVLGEERYSEFKENLDYQRQLDRLKRPEPIKKYAEMVRIACVYYGKMEKFHYPPVNRSLAKKFSDKADKAFETALEFLNEAVERDRELQIWIDRDVHNLTSFCPTSIPRVIGSNHHYCLKENKHPYPRLSKRQLLIDFLEMALYELEDRTLDEFMVDISDTDMYLREKRNFDFSEFKF